MVALAALSGAGCAADEEEPAATRESYLDSLADICRGTTEALDALPRPPTGISTADFADEAARLLAAEADAVRRLDPPDEVEDDHRAFVLNTDDQSSAWLEVAGTDQSDADALATATTVIGELTLGRNDLAEEMGVGDCARGAG